MFESLLKLLFYVDSNQMIINHKIDFLNAILMNLSQTRVKTKT